MVVPEFLHWSYCVRSSVKSLSLALSGLRLTPAHYIFVARLDDDAPARATLKSSCSCSAAFCSLILGFDIKPVNLPHRSISKINGQGSPLEEFVTCATQGRVNLMGLEEIQEAG